MSNQDFEGLDDLWTVIKKAAVSGHSGPNNGRIHDGCIFVTNREWDAINKTGSTKNWDDMTPVEKLSNIPIRIITNGKTVELADGRIMAAFDDTLYLLPEPNWSIPPLPRLYIDGMYI